MNKKGQLTLFLAICLIVIVTAIAFVVNVGLLVKAKINLQNAVDAAAFAGAATQAKHLTNIAYLNWELRNTYKEWMFKYYIIGQQSLNYLKNFSGSAVDFRRRTFDMSDGKPKDGFNFPSVCVHFGEANDVCEIADIPGILDFPPPGLPGVAEHHQAFVDALVASKSKDCAQRSTINATTAITWAYNTGPESAPALARSIPESLFTRVGAWPAALELALRIRNLEMLINRPPVQGPIRGNSDVLNENSIDSPLNERPLKAFISAYKNLSEDLKGDFTLFEVPIRKPADIDPDNAISNVLIPSDPYPSISEGGSPREKLYVDLRPMMVNLATFYLSLTTGSGQYTNDGADPSIGMRGRCLGNKIAIPVPGYIMGFMKNPAVITYYSVIGESTFKGLFYPFEGPGVKIRAQASAKPFGGRIGPHLVNVNHGNLTEITPVQMDGRPRTCPYVVGYKSNGTDAYVAGYPIPSDQNFWVQGKTETIGGIPDGNRPIKFGIPNLIYDYEGTVDSLNNASQCANNMETINPTFTEPGTSTDYKLGLFDARQFELFQNNLGDYNSGDSADKLEGAVLRARRPTLYEAANYLIPVPPADDRENIGVISSKVPIDRLGVQTYDYTIYAPLYGPGTLYSSLGVLESEVSKYLTDTNDGPITTFLEELKKIAQHIMTDSRTNSATAPDVYKGAAAKYYTLGSDGNPTNDYGAVANDENCSLATQYIQFLRATSGSKCGMTALREAIPKYFNTLTYDNPNYYKGIYSVPELPNGKTIDSLMTAYAPQDRQGIDNINGKKVILPAFTTASSTLPIAKRNFYSTKFIHTFKVAVPNAVYDNRAAADYFKFNIYHDKGTNISAEGTGDESSIIASEGKRNYLQQEFLKTHKFKIKDTYLY